jgi:hypothetical protein
MASVPTFAHEAYLKGSGSQTQTLMGWSVDISGDTAVVGAPGYQGSSGAAYVFVRTPAGWVEQARLLASNANTSDSFGTAVAIDGDTIVATAIFEASSATGVGGDQTLNDAAASGAAYVFTRSGAIWTQQAYLKPSNTQSSDRFGDSVDLSGDTIVVGVPQEDSAATGVDGDQADGATAAGAAYVFTRSGTTWSQQAYLKASNTGAQDEFGLAVGVSGDTIIVGAHQEDGSGAIDGPDDDLRFNAGAAYVFTRTGAAWTQQAYLKASNSDSSDEFGWGVAVSGDTAVVGAYREDSSATGLDGNQANNSAADSGAAYLFTRSSGNWTQQAYVKASNTEANDCFGRYIALDGDAMAIGSACESSGARGIDGDQASNSAPGSGAVYVFARSSAAWAQSAYVKATNGEAGDGFAPVGIDAGRIIVGATFEDSAASTPNGDQSDNSATWAGAAYIVGSPCFTAPFGDVSTGHPFCREIEWMKQSGVSTGFGDGTYRPASAVTRQAMSAFLARLGSAVLTDCSTQPFNDVPTTHPFCREIKWMKDQGISTGFSDGGYHPAENVTRQAMAAFVARLANGASSSPPPCTSEPFSDVPTSHPFCPYIEWVKDNGVATGFGDGTYGPTANITRQAMAAFMYRLNSVIRGGASAAPLTQLIGEPDAPATDAIPDLNFEFSPDDYAPHPDLGGLMVSYDTFYLAFNLDTTVGQANALLADIAAEIIGGVPGKAGEAEGILLVRVPSVSHSQLNAVIAQLNADPRVLVAVQDSLPDTLDIPAQPGIPDDWTWELTPQGGNWGLEATRVPQLWGFNRATAKLNRHTSTGVLDGGFNAHPDLAYGSNFSTGPGFDPAHGTHVAGTIAARYGNGIGVDGIDPFVDLAVDTADTDAGGWGVFTLLDEASDLQVVNLSLGQNWGKRGIDPARRGDAQILIRDEAKVFELWQALRALRGDPTPLLVVAAGNDSGKFDLGGVDVDARWSSPWTYAALADGVENIIVVEAVELGPGGVGVSRAGFSNFGGQVSAPGVGIESTVSTSDPYEHGEGTSFAAPHVTGIASYLLSLDPTLTALELRGLLIGGGIPLLDASPQVDAFSSALLIDQLRGDTSVLQRLLDIDDGTTDGNLRQECWSACSPIDTEDFDLDGGTGDGAVDMSDFRRWRDGLLQVENLPGLALDGGPEAPKKDINHNGTNQGASDENVYPSGDFNGDGVISRSATRFVPGHVNASATDLEVLQSLFQDDHYSATQLPDLINSADIHVDPSACVAAAGVTWIRTTILDAATESWVDDSNSTVSTEFTVPASSTGYLVQVETRNSDGNVVAVAQKKVDAKLGGDAWYSPTCGTITLTPRQVNVEMIVGETTTETVTLKSDGLAVNWEFTNSVAHVEPSITGGTLDADGDTDIDLTITCPDTPGGYGGLLYLSFTDFDGAPITKGVPEYLPADLSCVTGGVTVSPERLDLSVLVGHSETESFALFNDGPALNYVADTDDSPLTIDANATGEVPAHGRVDVTFTAQCPSTPGDYPLGVDLTFTRADGKPVTVVVPDTVPIDLQCVPLIAIQYQDHFAAVNVSPTYGTRHGKTDDYISNDGLGTATHRQTEWKYINYYDSVLDESSQVAIAPIGFGSVSQDVAVTDSYDWNDPSIGHREVSSTTKSEYTSSFDGSVARFTTTFTQGASQPHDVGGLESLAEGRTTLVFDVGATATVAATWSCGGQFPGASDWANSTIQFVDVDGHQPVFTATGDGTGNCTFEGTVPAGQYSFQAHALLRTTSDDPDGTPTTKNASYTLTITFP